MPRPGYDPAARARLLQRKVKGERNRVFLRYIYQLKLRITYVTEFPRKIII